MVDLNTEARRGRVTEKLPVSRALQIRIVLVRPRNPNNIGAAARAMMNFGFSDLYIVAPHAPVWEEAKSAAVGAEGVLHRATVVKTLLEATSDCSLVVGTVDPRRGQRLTPSALRDEISSAAGLVALVFGSEKTGLSRNDLSSCHRIMSIPTHPTCPSMNLGQAVAICCYEFAGIGRRPQSDSEETGDLVIATAGELETLLERSIGLLVEVGFLTRKNERRVTEELRRSLLRLRPTVRDLTIWRGALRKIRWKLGQ